MMKKNSTAGFLFFVFLLITPGILAQNTKRGFKLLEKAGYEKAREQFLGAVAANPENPTALLGLTLILADEKSPYFDLIGAWKYGSTIGKGIDKLTPDELEYIGEYFYNTEERRTNRPVKRKIEYSLDAVEAKLIKHIREENNLELVYRALEELPDFRHYNNVVHIRNQLEFRKYEKQNTLDGYLEFLNKFPDAAQVEKAIRHRNRIAFDNACRINTAEAYKSYMKSYPDAAEVNGALKRLHSVAFKDAVKANTIQSIEQFISEYPDALEIFEARQIQKRLLYEYAKRIQTLEAYNEFIRKYPEGQQYIDIFNLKSIDNGKRFISTYPLPSDNIEWARSFDEEENEELTACMAVDSLNRYIVGSTVLRADTGFTDAWIIKLDQEGKMIWNQYVGEPYNDELNLLKVTGRNEILGAGYTWTGTDSSSLESWVFKLGSDGTRLWSKKLGKMHIRTMTVSDNGSIILGGYLVNDSLQNLYSVIVLNDQGKRLWSRTYTGKGSIMHIQEFSDGNLLLVGTRWGAKISPKGYLAWEQSFGASDSIVACHLSDNDVSFLSQRDLVNLVMIRKEQNKPVTETQLAAPKARHHINSFLNAGPGRLILLVTADNSRSIYWIDTKKGTLTGSSQLPDGVSFNEILSDRSNNLIIGACNKEIVLIKNNGLTF